jgi:hypothetical protein
VWLGAIIIVLIYLGQILNILKWMVIGGVVGIAILTLLNAVWNVDLPTTTGVYVVLGISGFFGICRLVQHLKHEG